MNNEKLLYKRKIVKQTNIITRDNWLKKKVNIHVPKEVKICTRMLIIAQHLHNEIIITYCNK